MTTKQSRLTSKQMREVVLRLFLRYFRWILAVLGVGLLALGYVVLIAGKLEHVQTVSVSDFQKKEQTLAQARERLQQLRDMETKFRSTVTEADRHFLNRAIPDAPEIPNLLSILQDLAEQSGFEVSAVSISEQTPAPAATGDAAAQENLQGVLKAVRGETTAMNSGRLSAHRLVVRLALNGPQGYDAVKKLLIAVESNERLFDAESLSFSLGTDGTGLAQASARYDLSIQTVFLPPPTSNTP